MLRSFCFSGVLRSKGFFWYASNKRSSLEWSSAGPSVDIKTGPAWVASAMRTELVFIGADMVEADIRGALNGALLTKEEFARSFQQRVRQVRSWLSSKSTGRGKP